MKDKIIERLEKEKLKYDLKQCANKYAQGVNDGTEFGLHKAIGIVKQVAEENSCKYCKTIDNKFCELDRLNISTSDLEGNMHGVAISHCPMCGRELKPFKERD